MPEVLWFFAPVLTAAALSASLTPAVRALAVKVGAVDRPGGRKIHNVPVPRLGGLAVIGAVAVTLGALAMSGGYPWPLPPKLITGLALGMLPIFIVSIVDDIRSVSAGLKFLAHLTGAGIAVACDISLQPTIHLFETPLDIGAFALPLSLLWLVGVTNAFNIIDGLDGLSAGLALISAVSMAAVFILVGLPAMAVGSLVLAGALAGFLPYNTYPARLFLGDTGAACIGFCLAAFTLEGGSTLSTGFATLIPVVILGLPIADTIISMVRRLLHWLEHRVGGVFVADSNHIHHRLLALGVDHRSAVKILYGAGLVLAGAGFASVFMTAREAASFMMAVLLACLVGVQRLGYDEFAFIRRGTVLRMYETPLVKRGLFVVFVDIALVAVSLYVSLGLKFDEWDLALWRPAATLVSTFAPVTVAVFWWRGMYRGAWRVAALQDLTGIVASVGLSTALAAAAAAVLHPGMVPASLFAVYGLVSLTLTTAVRTSYVILHHSQARASHRGMPVLIYGAGLRGASAARELFQDPASGLMPVGFIDDDPRQRHRFIAGIPVLGTAIDLETLLIAKRATAVLIATPALSDERVAYVIHVCNRQEASLFKLDMRFAPVVSGVAAADHAAEQVAAPAEVSHDSTEPALGLCPACRLPTLVRSRAHGWFARLRKAATARRPYRCPKCGWAAWLQPNEALTIAVPLEPPSGGIDVADLDKAVSQTLPTTSGPLT